MAIIVSLRQAMKSVFGKIFMVGLFFAMFGGFGLSKIFLKIFGKGSFDGVALVNGTDISRPVFQAAVVQEEQRISAIRQQYGQNADLYMQVMGMSPDPQASALNSVVYSVVVDDFVKDMGVQISHEYIESQLSDPRFLMNEFGHLLPRDVLLKDGSVDTFGVLQFLKKSGQLAAIEQELEKKLVKQFALLMLQSAFFVPSFMIKQMYVEQKLGKKFSYLTFSFDTFLQKERAAGASDEALKAFYKEQNKNTKRYWIAEQRDATVWTFLPESYGVAVTQSDIDAYYTKNKVTRFIKDPVQIQVREIVFGELVERGLKTVQEEAEVVYNELLQNPNQFEALAKKYSTAKSTAAKGGLVDWFTRGKKSKEYEKAAFKLKEDGEISPLVKVGDTLVILQRVARKDATFESIEKVRPEIVKMLTDQKFRVEFTRQANQLSRQENTAAALKNFVGLHKATESVLQNKEKTVTDMTLQRLFALKTVGDFAVLVQDGKGIIVQYTGKKESKEAPFDQVRSTVAADYYERQATKALETAVKKAKEKAITSKKLVSVDGGKISSTGWIKPTDKTEMEALAKQGFPQGFIELDWAGAVLSSLSKTGGVVIRLDEIEEFESELQEDQKKTVLKDVFERNSTLFSQAFIASLFRNATIKVSDELSRVKDQL